MKIHKILTVAFIAFLIGFIVLEKVVLKKQVSQIDKNDRFGGYHLQQSLPPFKHVVVTGNDAGITKFFQGMKSRSIRYNDSMKDQFIARVKNDTLFIDYKESMSLNQKSIFNVGANNLNNVAIFYDTIASIRISKNRTYVLANELKSLKVNAEKNSWFCLHGSKVGYLDITLDKSLANFNFGPSTYTDSITANIDNHSNLALKNLFTKKHNLKASEDSKIDREGFNEAHIP